MVVLVVVGVYCVVVGVGRLVGVIGISGSVLFVVGVILGVGRGCVVLLVDVYVYVGLEW